MKKYSKLSVLFLALFVLVLSSCENEALEGFDSNDGNPFTNSLIGTWALSDFDVTVNNTSDVGGTSIESNVEIDGFNPNYNLTFAANTFTTNGSYSYNTVVTVNGQTNTDSYTLDNVTGAGVYSTNGNEMTVDGSFFEFTFQGMDLSELGGEQTVNYAISADGQTLTFTQNTTETNSSGGSTTTSIVNATSVWTKTNDTNNSCNVASNFASSAETAYNNDTTNADLCDAYRAALQNQINVCGDSTGEIQTIIDGLGDCTSGGGTNGFAMTYKVNGIFKQVNNAFNNNEASGTTVWAAYPTSDYILLQGGGGFTSAQEVNIWIERSLLVSGTTISIDNTTFQVSSHIDYIDNSNSFSEDTQTGIINITFVDPVNKIVQGTFELSTIDEDNPVAGNEFDITEGTFNYTYE